MVKFKQKLEVWNEWVQGRKPQPLGCLGWEKEAPVCVRGRTWGRKYTHCVPSTPQSPDSASAILGIRIQPSPKEARSFLFYLPIPRRSWLWVWVGPRGLAWAWYLTSQGQLLGGFDFALLPLESVNVSRLDSALVCPLNCKFWASKTLAALHVLKRQRSDLLWSLRRPQLFHSC